MMTRVYATGIDFGTSNSCVCIACYRLRSDGRLSPRPIKRPEPVTIQSGETVPTALFLGADGEPTVFGEIAEEKAMYYPGGSLFYPDLVKTHFKLDLGAPGQQGVEAFQHATEFLRLLKKRLEQEIPFGEPDAEFVTYIGHPVQWSAEQRRLTRQAAVDAGFPRVFVEDETSAALYNHLFEQQLELQPEKSARILAIDMGGGTTDFAFIELPADPSAPPIAAPVDPSRLVEPWDGDRHTYGGRDIDDLLLRHFAAELGYTASSRHWAFLLRETRRFKEQFSNAVSRGRSEYQADWVVEDTPRTVSLTRVEFEDISRAFTRQFPRLIHAALALEELRPSDVDAVILTGGSSRWYWVEDTVQEIFPHISTERHNLVRHQAPEQSVARGLAYRCLVDAMGARPRPRRRATHGVWIGSPATSSRGDSPTETLALLMPRGQLLPFTSPTPITLEIDKADFDPGQASIQLKIYSGSAEASRQELFSFDRVAVFQRPLMERLLKRIARIIPWGTSYDRDRFEVQAICSVDESEQILGRVTITRFRGNRPLQQVVQILETAPSTQNDDAPERSKARMALS